MIHFRFFPYQYLAFLDVTWSNEVDTQLLRSNVAFLFHRVLSELFHIILYFHRTI